ncbi:hypothetical protein ACLB2K_037706 [Fragaria x ananassa]
MLDASGGRSITSSTQRLPYREFMPPICQECARLVHVMSSFAFCSHSCASFRSALSPLASPPPAPVPSALSPLDSPSSPFSSDCPSSPLSPVYPVATRQSATCASPLRPIATRLSLFYPLVGLSLFSPVAGLPCRHSATCATPLRPVTTFPLTMKRVRLNSSKVVKRGSSMSIDSNGRGRGRGVTSSTMNNSSSSSQMQVDSVGVGESATPTPVPSMGGSQATEASTGEEKENHEMTEEEYLAYLKDNERTGTLADEKFSSAC